MGADSDCTAPSEHSQLSDAEAAAGTERPWAAVVESFPGKDRNQHQYVPLARW